MVFRYSSSDRICCMAIELTCCCTSCSGTVTITISDSAAAITCPKCMSFFKTRNIVGYLYILSNPEMPGLLKIGQTTRTVPDRVAELNSATAVPAPFTVEAWFESADPQSHKADLHKLLADCRLPNREFFRITIDDAVTTARQVTGRAAAQGRLIARWEMIFWSNIEPRHLHTDHHIFARRRLSSTSGWRTISAKVWPLTTAKPLAGFAKPRSRSDDRRAVASGTWIAISRPSSRSPKSPNGSKLTCRERIKKLER